MQSKFYLSVTLLATPSNVSFLCLFFQAVLSAAGRCHLLMGNWEAALGSAEIVITKQPRDPKAILVKAEALFNLCYFERALMYFSRGQVSF